MRNRGDLLIWVNRLLSAKNPAEADDALRELGTSAANFRDGLDFAEHVIERSEIAARLLPGGGPFPVSSLSDEQIAQLNQSLPWATVTLDEQGRHIGSPWSSEKRSNLQFMVEKRHLELNKTYPFAGKHVLEVGCFEGIHTISCLALGAQVTAVDTRMENLLKTVTRLWLYGFRADVMNWDLEQEAPQQIPQSWDMLHHVGVLYHLSDPVRHLRHILQRTSEALLLDTHIARDKAEAEHTYIVDGQSFPYFHHGEKTASPFAGVKEHAKWLLLEDLQSVVADAGFGDIRVADDRDERNGRRITLWAFRK